MKRRCAPRRHRVALRPKVRRRRLRLLAAAAALGLLVCAAALTARHVLLGRLSVSGLLGALSPRPARVEVLGAPPALAEPLTRYLSGPGAAFDSRLSALSEQFPAVRAWRVQRRWLGRSARVEVTLRRAVAVLRRAGQPAGFLDEDGIAFEAPPELFGGPGLLPIEIGAAGARDLKALPTVLEEVGRDPHLPAPVARVAFRSPYEGWQLGLQDGTEVLWGNLDWPREKLARLRAALDDARGVAAAVPMLADLRYFEDGRVLLRPLGR